MLDPLSINEFRKAKTTLSTAIHVFRSMIAKRPHQCRCIVLEESLFATENDAGACARNHLSIDFFARCVTSMCIATSSIFVDSQDCNVHWLDEIIKVLPTTQTSRHPRNRGTMHCARDRRADDLQISWQVIACGLSLAAYAEVAVERFKARDTGEKQLTSTMTTILALHDSRSKFRARSGMVIHKAAFFQIIRKRMPHPCLVQRNHEGPVPVVPQSFDRRIVNPVQTD
nr:hypothetical protein CFP56_63514 [Quercus suber]